MKTWVKVLLWIVWTPVVFLGLLVLANLTASWSEPSAAHPCADGDPYWECKRLYERTESYD